MNLLAQSRNWFSLPSYFPIHSQRSVSAMAFNYLNGKRVQLTEGTGNKRYLVNPATGEVIDSFHDTNSKDVEDAVINAHNAQKLWKRKSGFERGQILRKAADLVRAECESLLRVEVLDTGKPIYEARMDILGCADALEFFGGIAPTIKGNHFSLSNGNYGYTIMEPIGVVGAIGAWNYPFQMACWKSAPALACGNTMVFKPSQLTPQTAVLLAEIYSKAGLPDGCFNVVQGAEITGQALTSSPEIHKVSFTGSVNVGSKVMSACAQSIKHVTLELGGKSPIIIFDDADIDDSVTGAMYGNWMTQGQVCSNGTRVYVHKSVFDEFLEKLIKRTDNMKIGDPNNEDTKIGAMISEEHAKKVMGYIDLAKQEGARIMYGGDRVQLSDNLSGGYYLRPCILVDCHDDMRVVREEIFGAVMCVLPFETEEEALRRANDTNFGLAAGVFTKDITRAHRVVSELEAGTCYINNYNIYPVEIPFGGYKTSGIGRECGELCLQFYCQSKSVYVEMNKATDEAPF